MKFVFVVLHYVTINDTIECVNSIVNKIIYDNYSVVIVDNGSPDNSYDILSDIYKNNNRIYVTRSDNNLGFAKGNNIGFKFAKYKLNADFICLINNDTIINQVEFIERIIQNYKNNEYYVLGPDIVSTIDGFHQNPFKLEVADFRSVVIDILKLIIQLTLNYLHLDKKISNILRFIFKHKEHNNMINSIKMNNNSVLHGSCLCFSPLYINMFDGLYNKTFMYGEEDILFYICNTMKLKYVYDSSISILHKESSSTKKVLKNKSYMQLRFYYKNKLKSSIELMKIMINKERYFKKYIIGNANEQAY